MSSQHTMFFDGYWFETSVFSIVVYTTVSVFTICANVLLCVAYWKDPFDEIQSAQNYYVLNLGIADLIMGAISEPLLVITYWDNKNLIFMIHYLFAIISASCSLLNITALSIIRYFAVQRPFQTQSIVNKRNVKISIAVIWGISFHYALLPALGWRGKTFQLYLYGLGCVIPTLVFILAYFMVYRALRHHTIMIARLGEQRSLPFKNAIRNEKAATRTVLLVLIVFISLWIPFLSIDFVMVQCTKCRTDQFHLARDITLSLVYFSSGINPVIYAWRIKSFRRAFLQVTRICFGRISFQWRPRTVTWKVNEGTDVAQKETQDCRLEYGFVNLAALRGADSFDSGCCSSNPEEMRDT